MSRVHPFVIAFGEAFPFDQVLEFPCLSITPMAYDSFDLVLRSLVSQAGARAEPSLSRSGCELS